MAMGEVEDPYIQRCYPQWNDELFAAMSERGSRYTDATAPDPRGGAAMSRETAMISNESTQGAALDAVTTNETNAESGGSSLLDTMAFPLYGQRLIEASAGTGKTYTIAILYLRLLLGHGGKAFAHPRPLSVDEILVVTFTEGGHRRAA